MAKGYWKAVLAAAFFIVAGVCYGGSLFQEGSIVLEGETEAGGAGVQTADGAEDPRFSSRLSFLMPLSSFLYYFQPK